MNLFLEAIQFFKCQEAVESVYGRLPEALQAIGFEVLKRRDFRREIEFKCVVELVNLVLWRCWADKVIIRLSASEGTTTRVEILCGPNLLWLKVKPGERVLATDELEASVRRAIATLPGQQGAAANSHRDAVP